MSTWLEDGLSKIKDETSLNSFANLWGLHSNNVHVERTRQRIRGERKAVPYSRPKVSRIVPDGGGLGDSKNTTPSTSHAEENSIKVC